MKKYLVILICILTTAFCYAQDAPHLKFKGIPLTGTVTSFVEKLKSKGMTYLGESKGIVLLKGDFAGFKDCTIGVSTLEDSDQVCNVVAIFPQRETWGTITDDYNSLKSLLADKYGAPEVSETFSGIAPYDDFTKFSALLNDECNFMSTFHVEGGNIQLTMKKMDNKTASVILNYLDKVNGEIVKKKAIDDL
ncbi:MAG: hypothetical protein LKK21_04720 [Prevotella sp.]|nr:hypothetical protein [Prevotella sp.]MCI2124938.1 hypothetical protein [Prevotella sp.]